ncbi:MAG TPA: DNA gyrase inhibitor YacG [Pseudomonadota bacterium]|jgi:endogenous inhibitor of DNA gyrase (YacG/DUF329 family)|nr:DNA gyrase inhibitor YacG [Pseudomonadota bacterium]HND09681.1 DNA gyrase inhibitor YacG [Pseudomonadota bacterium]HNF97002.1 DNA gyrase inhibitor YacG [Pseudomonadota bacterium]HNI60525.1 DNA gyrase inhibitor YacG [Pseudomonadota bacterium]HNK43665.1 DNA gyrase inhibitor YacG [Pseudomonadota bacterium]
MSTLHCPICKKALPDDPNPPKKEARSYGPFCSARCQKIDLGNWLGERYAVPGDPTVEEPEPRELPS